MDFQTKLKQYAQLIVRAGCNLQPGQELFLRAPIACADFAREIVKSAYEAGGGEVTVQWTDEIISRYKYDYCPQETFERVPDWLAELNNGIAKRGAAILSIAADDPDVMAGVDPRKPAAWVKASHEACKPFFDGMNLGKNVWCIVSAPSPAWAKKVFPGCGEEEAVSKLWDAIFRAVRADTPDPVAAWEAHRRSFEEKIAFLNEMQFDRIHYQNALGTDITLGMPKQHRWAGGGDRTVDGVYFFPNMPTEEIFCSPDKDRVDGVVYSALPLNYQGNLLDRFSLTFEQGRITGYSAEQGYDTLRELVETDEGSHHLGELALIPKQSPISEMGILFYNTLYDENASCHFAIGRGFAECVEGGREMSEEELFRCGVNRSATHVDFMIGTDDLQITGIRADGTEIPLFRDGNWAF